MRHLGYAASQVVRKRIEEQSGWSKTAGRIRQTVFRGLQLVNKPFKPTRMLSAIGATAADRAVYRDGDIEVVVLTSRLPRELAGSEPDADSQWFGVRSMVTRSGVNVGEAHAVLPTRAFLGMTDRGDVNITRSTRKGGWTLTVTGGDASTAYRTVMEFAGENVRRLKEYARGAGDAHPYITETFAVPAVLN